MDFIYSKIRVASQQLKDPERWLLMFHKETNSLFWVKMCFWVVVLSLKNLKMCETYLLPRLTICIFQWLLISYKNIICQDHLAQLTHFTEKIWSIAVILNLECVSESPGGLLLTKSRWVTFIMFYSLVVQIGGGSKKFYLI